MPVSTANGSDNWGFSSMLKRIPNRMCEPAWGQIQAVWISEDSNGVHTRTGGLGVALGRLPVVDVANMKGGITVKGCYDR